MSKKEVFPVKCAVFCPEDGLHHCEVGLHRPRSRTSEAMKTVVTAMKSLLMAEKGYFSFETFRAEETFVLLQAILRKFSFSTMSFFRASRKQKDTFFRYPAESIQPVVPKSRSERTKRQAGIVQDFQ